MMGRDGLGPVRVARIRHALLFVALALVAISAYQPHMRADSGYSRFPTHMDEYVHWGYARAIQRTGYAEPTDPFTTPVDYERIEGAPRYPTQIHERGFQAYLAALQSTTGIPWVILLEWLPVAMALVSALAIYAIGERAGFGAEAALCLAAVPTSLRFLGPGFVVPIAWSIPLVLAALLVVMRGGADVRASIALGLLTAGLWTIHAMGALVASLLTAVVLLARPPTMKVASGLLLVSGVGLLAWPYYARDLEASVLRETWLPPGIDSIRLVGAALFVLAAIGGGALVLKRDAAISRLAAAIGGLVLASLALMLYRIEGEADPLRLYDRTVTLLFPFLAILAGAAVLLPGVLLRGVRLRPHRAALAAIATAAILVAQGAAVASAMVHNSEQEHYLILDEDRFARYEAAAPMLGSAYRMALVDGLSSMAWTDITGIPVLFAQTPGPTGPPDEIRKFFENGSRDTIFLVRHGVTVVVTDATVANPMLEEVVPGVYVLPLEVAERISATTR